MRARARDSCQQPDEEASPREKTVTKSRAAPGKWGRRRQQKKKNTVGFFSRRISVSERGRVTDEIGFAAAVQVIHAAEEIHGALHSRVAADFPAVKLCDLKMNRFTRGPASFKNNLEEAAQRRRHEFTRNRRGRERLTGMSERALLQTAPSELPLRKSNIHILPRIGAASFVLSRNVT